MLHRLLERLIMSALQNLDDALARLSASIDRLDAAVAALPAPDDTGVQAAADTVSSLATRVDTAVAILAPTAPAPAPSAPAEGTGVAVEPTEHA